VQTFDVETRTPNVVLDPREGLELRQRDLELVHGAIRNAGICELEPDIIEALHETDLRPLICLLFTSLPNLTSIDADVPETNVILREVLKQALNDHHDTPPRQAFQNLRTVFLQGDGRLPMVQSAGPIGRRLDNLWPILCLPNIESLQLFNFNPHGAAVAFGNKVGISSLKHLHLTLHRSSCITALDIQTILALPKTLVSLSLHEASYLKNSK